MARRDTAQPVRDRGFTLVEVLVALAIVAVALMGALRAVGSLTDASAELRARSLALWSAENRLARIRVEGEWPAPGRRSTACPQATVSLICEEEVFQTPRSLLPTGRGHGLRRAANAPARPPHRFRDQRTLRERA